MGWTCGTHGENLKKDSNIRNKQVTTIINKLLVFERKTLRKIFGPSNENGIRRIKTNQELDEIIKHKNRINFIRAQRLSWLGHMKG
jgi:hypothetical protein